MDPEEMDVVELLTDVPMDPGWRVGKENTLETLQRGARGMVIHRHEGTSRYDIEFVDDATNEPIALATLSGDQVKVVERYTLEAE
ncbi:MAG TPA: DUF4926 domain-containing protein [Ktedonobacterales bacterium]|nr:DUF4926 domain-containing protein [Ktedonobacterales bacterium]